ncbi:hypothetical protein [Nocardioides insulae]|uniref:hypothetical protein n=1 Tax=Nocardioides insulae TaxID=394734 RepID=UPI0006861D89|nr:hypothetical protein [Nocardioides insulae]
MAVTDSGGIGSAERPGSLWYRVPVERRVLGLDKRSLPFAVVVVALWLLMYLLVPWINDQVTDDDVTVAGDQMKVTDSLAITPTAGWSVELGLRTDSTFPSDPEEVVLTKGGVQLVAQGDTFDGDANDLLDQVNRLDEALSPGPFNPSTDRTTITTDSGITGVGESLQSAGTAGRIYAFTADGEGVVIQVSGPVEQMDTMAREVTQVVESLAPIGSSGGDS